MGGFFLCKPFSRCNIKKESGGDWGEVGLLFLGLLSINYHFFLAVPSGLISDHIL